MGTATKKPKESKDDVFNMRVPSGTLDEWHRFATLDGAPSLSEWMRDLARRRIGVLQETASLATMYPGDPVRSALSALRFNPLQRLTSLTDTLRANGVGVPSWLTSSRLARTLLSKRYVVESKKRPGAHVLTRRGWDRLVGA